MNVDSLKGLGENLISTYMAFGGTGHRIRFAIFLCPVCRVKQEKLVTSSIVRRGGTCTKCYTNATTKNAHRCIEPLKEHFISTYTCAGSTGIIGRRVIFSCPVCKVKQDTLSTSSIILRGGTCSHCHKARKAHLIESRDSLTPSNIRRLLNKLRVKQS